jgi:hypothetical protein
MIIKQLLVAALLGVTSLPSFAQGDGNKVELRMLAFNTSLAEEEVYAQDPAAQASAASVKTPIKSYLNHEFFTVPLVGRKIVFTSKPDRGSLTREGELVGEITLPQNVKSAILLFFPKSRPEDKAQFRIMPIDDSKKGFPAGSYFVTNLAPQKVRLKLEEKVYDYNPGQISLIEDPPVGDNQQTGMMGFVWKNNKWEPIASSIWTVPGKDRRNILLMFPDSKTNFIEIRNFDDLAPREPSAPSTGA